MPTPSFDDTPVWDVWLSAYGMPTVVAADELALFEALHERSGDADELGGRLGLDPATLKAVLPLLTSLGFLVVRLDRYHLTGPAELYLLKQSPFYWGHAFSMHRGSHWAERIKARLRSRPDGEGQERRPVDAWESGQLDLQMARGICAFMHSHSLPAALGVAESPKFETTRRLLDVGGGSGCFSVALAQRWPQLESVILELPVMCELAQGYIEAGAVQDRVTTTVVDMFRQPWPTDFDAVFMSNIFHDWDGPTCAELAAKAHAALKPGGRLHLHEMLISDDGSGPASAAAFSILMLVGTRGRQYSAAELQRILEGAGFVDVEVDAAYGYYSLVTGHKR
jgi:acetylserotonin N-methyltransferase